MIYKLLVHCQLSRTLLSKPSLFLSSRKYISKVPVLCSECNMFNYTSLVISGMFICDKCQLVARLMEKNGFEGCIQTGESGVKLL